MCARIIFTIAGAKTSVYIDNMCVIFLTNSTFARTHTHNCKDTFSWKMLEPFFFSLSSFIRQKKSVLQNVYHCNLFWSNRLSRVLLSLCCSQTLTNRCRFWKHCDSLNNPNKGNQHWDVDIRDREIKKK